MPSQVHLLYHAFSMHFSHILQIYYVKCVKNAWGNVKNAWGKHSTVSEPERAHPPLTPTPQGYVANPLFHSIVFPPGKKSCTCMHVHLLYNHVLGLGFFYFSNSKLA